MQKLMKEEKGVLDPLGPQVRFALKSLRVEGVLPPRFDLFAKDVAVDLGGVPFRCLRRCPPALPEG